VNVSQREVNSEFLGTFVLMVFGLGANAQVTLGAGDYGDWLSLCFGWGVAVTLAVYVAGPTGAHINPAVTLAMAVNRRLPWNKVIPYMLAQFAGAFIAAALIYFVYYEAIGAFEHVVSGSASARSMATAGIWGTFPREFVDGSVLSPFGGFVDQFVATAMLVLCVCALGDSRNLAPQSNLAPFAVGAIVLMIGIGFGFNCGYAINPARDFSPRMLSYIAGWGSQVFTEGNYFFWVPILGPLAGGAAGGAIYDLFITQHHPPESNASD